MHLGLYLFIFLSVRPSNFIKVEFELLQELKYQVKTWTTESLKINLQQSVTSLLLAKKEDEYESKYHWKKKTIFAFCPELSYKYQQEEFSY